MKHLAYFALSMLIPVFSAFGQRTENSLLWKISGNGMEKSAYLYGTYHLLCPGDLQIPEKARIAFLTSDRLVLELNFGDPSVMPSIQQNMVFTDGTTARDYLSQEEYRLVARFFTDSMNMPFERLQFIKPFFLSSITLQHFLGCKPVSFEQKLTAMAEKQNMEVEGLETVKEQIGFVKNIPLKVQKKMLVNSLRNYRQSKKLFDRMMAHYRNEHISELSTLIGQYMHADYAEFENDLLVKRNKNWMEKMEAFMGQKTTFIAVGAGHLAGRGGLLTLLKSAGYRVEAVL